MAMTRFHPLANLFPLIEGPEFHDLVADIRANGQHEPIVVLDGLVLDGRNRYRACVAAGVRPRAVTFRPDVDGDPLAFVISRNLKRRHLSDDQRRLVAAKIANLPRGVHAGADTANCGISRAEAARLVNVDEAGTERARTVIAKGAPSLVRAVERGKLSVSQAAIAARLGRAQQERIASEAEAGRANVARAAIKREARAAREADLRRTQAAGNLAFPTQQFGVVVADPQWGRTVYSTKTGLDRHAANHYPVATGNEATQDDAIKALPVASIAAKDCVLGLWCTDPHRGVDVMRSWQFEPKSYFVWIKDIIEIGSDRNGRAMFKTGDNFEVIGAAGLGHIRRDRCELMLIGSRGNPVWPAPGTQGNRCGSPAVVSMQPREMKFTPTSRIVP